MCLFLSYKGNWQSSYQFFFFSHLGGGNLALSNLDHQAHNEVQAVGGQIKGKCFSCAMLL